MVNYSAFHWSEKARKSAEEAKSIKESLGSIYQYKGSVNTIADLPENANIGDVYDVLDSGTNYAWTGDRWDSLGASFDLSEYAKKTDIKNGTLTIQKNGVNIATFTANQSGNTTANIVADTQVNADWNATGGVAQILNKPTIPTTTSQLTNNSGFTTKDYVDTTEQEIIQNFMDADTALQTQITGLSGVLDGEQDKITAIEGKIPTNASTSNMLSTASDLLNATQDVRSDFAEADSELQIQINGQATAISDLSDDVMANMGEIADIKEQIKNVGSGRNVGDIFYTTRTDTELKGAVECNGATFNTSDFSGSESIGNLLSDGKVPYVSLNEYANIVSTNGSCRAFGWDGDDSFRVPTIPAILLTKEQASVVGNGMTLGLTDGTNNFGITSAATGEYGNRLAAGTNQYGTTAGSKITSTGTTVNNQTTAGITTDPTKSGIVANLDTVQYRAMVQLANEATDEALITATSALQQIANKVDKTSAIDRETVVGWGMPDFSSGVSKSLNIIYQAESDGWISIRGQGNGSTATFVLNYSSNNDMSNPTEVAGDYFNCSNNEIKLLPIPKGMFYQATQTTSYFSMIFYPVKGAQNA